MDRFVFLAALAPLDAVRTPRIDAEPGVAAGVDETS
jgi:hypothetical protein